MKGDGSMYVVATVGSLDIHSPETGNHIIKDMGVGIEVLGGVSESKRCINTPPG